MGFILRQSAKFTVLNFILVAIGALSIFFIYPNNLKLYGELNLLYFSANLITPIISLGFSNAILKYHQRFTRLGFENNYLAFTLLGSLFTSSIGFLIFILLKDLTLLLLSAFNVPIEFIAQNYYFIGILSFVLVLNSSLIYYCSIQKRIVVPELISNGGYKIFVPSIILISTMSNFSTYLYFYINLLFFLFVFLIILYYSYSLKEQVLSPKFSSFSVSEIYEGWFFILLSAINNFFYHLIFKLDIIIVGIYLSPEMAGIYAILIFIVSLLEIPNKSLTQITTPLVSKYLAEANWIELKKLYTESSQNLFLLGSFMYFLIIFNIGYLGEFVPKFSFSNEHITAVVFIGLSRLIDMTFSLNSQIILFSSRFYIYNILTVLIGCLNLFLCQYCIVNYGFIGVASSVLFSVALFNIFKSLYIWASMGMNPMDKRMVYVLLFISVVHLIWYFFPMMDHAIFGIGFSTFLIGVLYLTFFYIFKPSRILNGVFLGIFNKLQFNNRTNTNE